MAISKARLFFIFGLGVVLVSCTQSSTIDAEIGHLSKVIRPLGFPKSTRLETVEHKKALEQVNAIYYYLLSERLKNQGHEALSEKVFENAFILDQESETLLLHKAVADVKANKLTESISRVQKILEINPKNKEAQVLLANLYATTKQYSEAKKTYEIIQSQAPDDEEIMLYLALLEIEEKKLDKAFDRLVRFTRDNPDTPLTYFYIGRIEQERGQIRKALEAYKKAVQLRPGFVQAGTYMAFIQEELGDKKSALETYGWLADQTDDVVFYKKQAQLYLEQNQTQKALMALENLERLEPQDLNTRLRIGLVCLELGQKEKAVLKFKEILKESPDSGNIHFYLGAVLEELGKSRDALHHYEQVSLDSKVYVDAVKRRIYLYGKTGQFEKGQELLARWEAEYEIDEEFYESAALLHQNAGPMGTLEPFKILDEGISKFPESETLVYLKASFFEERNQREQALLTMKEILKRNPNHVGALNFIGYIWADMGVELDKSEAYLAKALSAKPNDPYIRDSWAWLLFKRGEYARAKEILEELRKEKPDEPVFLEHLADVLVKMGILGEAKTLYEAALKMEFSKQSDRQNVLFKVGTLEKILQRWACQDISRAPASEENQKCDAPHDDGLYYHQMRDFKSGR